MLLFTNTNNSVQAIMSKTDYGRVIMGEPVTSIFLFVPRITIKSFLDRGEPIHGTREDLSDWLQENHNQLVVDSGLYVPFSNGKQLYSQEELLRHIESLAPLHIPWHETLPSLATAR